MDIKAVVSASDREKIKEVLKEVAVKKGDFYLAMLIQTLEEVRDRYTLVVSAPWTDSSTSRRIISDLSSRLSRKLDRNALSAIDRILVIPTADPIALSVVQHFSDLGKDVSDIQGGFHLRTKTIVGGGTGEEWGLGEGFVLIANPTALGRHHRQPRETHGVAG